MAQSIQQLLKLTRSHSDRFVCYRGTNVYAQLPFGDGAVALVARQLFPDGNRPDFEAGVGHVLALRQELSFGALQLELDLRFFGFQLLLVLVVLPHSFGDTDQTPEE